MSLAVQLRETVTPLMLNDDGIGEQSVSYRYDYVAKFIIQTPTKRCFIKRRYGIYVFFQVYSSLIFVYRVNYVGSGNFTKMSSGISVVWR